MESHKDKVLRVITNIFNIEPGISVIIYHTDGTKYKGICKCVNGNYDIYNFYDDNISWGLSCKSLDEMRDALVLDFINTNTKDHYIDDIHIIIKIKKKRKGVKL